MIERRAQDNLEWHLQDSLSLPASHPAHLDLHEYVLLLALLRQTGGDGWARENGRQGLRQSVIAAHCGRSISRTRHLVAALQKRCVIEARGTVGEAAEYQILPKERWLPPKAASKKVIPFRVREEQ